MLEHPLHSIWRLTRDAKYLRVSIGEGLTFRRHLELTQKEANAARSQLFLLIGRRSELTVDNKKFIIKMLRHPVLTCVSLALGYELSQRKEKLSLKKVTNVPRFLSNKVIFANLNHTLMTEKIKKNVTSIREPPQLTTTAIMKLQGLIMSKENNTTVSSH